MTDVTGLPERHWGHVVVLHTDPAPEAFVRDDRAGVTALIDWAGARRGPVLYYVA